MPDIRLALVMKLLLLLFTSLVSCDVLSMDTLKPYTGDEFPAFELTDLDGETHRLADYRAKSRMSGTVRPNGTILESSR